MKAYRPVVVQRPLDGIGLLRATRILHSTSTGSSATSKSRSISALVHGIVPGVIIIAAPAAIPNRTDLLNDQSRLKPT